MAGQRRALRPGTHRPHATCCRLPRALSAPRPPKKEGSASLLLTKQSRNSPTTPLLTGILNEKLPQDRVKGGKHRNMKQPPATPPYFTGVLVKVTAHTDTPSGDCPHWAAHTAPGRGAQHPGSALGDWGVQQSAPASCSRASSSAVTQYAPSFSVTAP